MRRLLWWVILFALAGGTPASAQPGRLPGKASRPPASGPVVTIHAPHAARFEVALDEVELDWSRVPGIKNQAPAHAAATVPGAAVARRNAHRATVAVPRAAALADLRATAMALEAANPGALTHLVLYEAGRPRSEATRRILTRDVGLLLEKGEDPVAVLATVPAGSLSALPGVADAYVVDAGDPVSALALADALRADPRVRAAYPLLQRRAWPR
jgi:hypothetical protein